MMSYCVAGVKGVSVLCAAGKQRAGTYTGSPAVVIDFCCHTRAK